MRNASRRSRRGPLLALGIGVVIAAVLAVVLVVGPHSGSPGSTAGAAAQVPAGEVTAGDRAPAFSLPVLGSAGAPDTLTGLDSGPLVVNFWSSTCTICVQEMPALQEVDDAFGGAVRFVGIDVVDPSMTAAAFAAKLGVHYTLLSDANGTVAAAYGVDALPVTFVVSPAGTILARHEGVLTRAQFEAMLARSFPSLPAPAVAGT